MRTIVETLLAGGELDEGSYQFAEDNVEIVKEMMEGDYYSDIFQIFPTKRMLKVMIYYMELTVYIRTFEKVSANNRIQSKNFFEFETNFTQQSPGIDALYGPILSLIRCRIQRTAQDMSSTLDKDQLFTFLLKEKQWYVEMLLTLQIFKTLEYFNKIKDALGSLDIMKALNFQVDLDNGSISTSYSGQVTAETVVEDLRRYLSLVKKKINNNLPAVVVTAQGEVVSFELSEYVRERSAFQGALFVSVFLPENTPPAFQRIGASLLANPIQNAIAKLDANAIQGIVLAQQFYFLLNSADAQIMINALKNGDFAQFFQVDIVNSVKKELEAWTSALLNCLNTQENPDPQLVAKAQNSFEKAQEQVRASATWRDIYYNSNDRHFQSVVLGELDDY